MAQYAELLALRFDAKRTRQAYYRAMRVLHEHFQCDSATLEETHLRDYLMQPGRRPPQSGFEPFAKAYEEASPDDQAALRFWMRQIILPGKVKRNDIERARRSEKQTIEARDRRILEFAPSMTTREMAQALRGEGWYSRGTTIHYIEHRIRRLRAKANS